jgi:hypothetical protein
VANALNFQTQGVFTTLPAPATADAHERRKKGWPRR